MWTTISQVVTNERIIKYEIHKNNRPLSRIEVINNWKTNEAFRRYYNAILANCEFEGYFWEHPSITKDTLHEAYEFVVVKSNILTRIQATPNSFIRYFDTDKKAVSFLNLSGDARLLVPTPISDHKNYPHLGQFVRHAPDEQQDEFWQMLGDIYFDMIDDDKKWLSTSGLGVYWLHIRIDARPKYYSYKEYH